MTYDNDSPCVYNVPLALDPDGSHEDGLDPRFATARCRDHFASGKEGIVGPMPPLEFIDWYLPPAVPASENQRLSSKNAFNALPSGGVTESDVWRPLVCAVVCSVAVSWRDDVHHSLHLSRRERNTSRAAPVSSSTQRPCALYDLIDAAS